jgi:hypothetical protein
MSQLRNALLDSSRRHGPSTKRFWCLIDVNVSDTEETTISNYQSGSFFLVASRSTSIKEIVYVSDEGYFACTDPYFANMGCPDHFILNVYLAGHCLFNPLAHLHPFYLRPNFDLLKEDQKVKFTVKMNNCDFSIDRLRSVNQIDGISVSQAQKKNGSLLV